MTPEVYKLLEPLVQYGAIGVILSLILALFMWVFRRLFNAMLDEHASFRTFMSESVAAIREVKTAIEHGNEQILQRMEALAERSSRELREHLAATPARQQRRTRPPGT